MSNNKGIFIPIKILMDMELNGSEKLVLSILIELSGENGKIKISNSDIAEKINTSEPYVAKTLGTLRKKRYIENEYLSKKMSNRVIKLLK